MSSRGKGIEGLFTLVFIVVGMLWFTGRLDKTIEEMRRTWSSVPKSPRAQQDFMAIDASYAAQYSSAANDILRDRLPGERDAALCAALPDRHAQDWIGRVVRVDLTTSGFGIVELQMEPHSQVTTGELELLDVGHLMAPAHSHLAASLETFKVGEYVRFSGDFQAAGRRCIAENSLTDAGSMGDPEFAFRFTALEHLRAAGFGR